MLAGWIIEEGNSVQTLVVEVLVGDNVVCNISVVSFGILLSMLIKRAELYICTKRLQTNAQKHS